MVVALNNSSFSSRETGCVHVPTLYRILFEGKNN